MRHLSAALAASAIVAVLAPTRPAGAQQSDSLHAQKTFFTKRDAVVGGSYLAVAAGLSIFDKRIEHFFEDTSLAHVREGDRLGRIFTHVNETTLTAGGLLTYGAARLLHAPAVADVAFHTSESVMLASLVSQVIRGPLGRARPTASPDDQYDFEFGRGFTRFDRRAFPSIHSASGFAAASAIVAETKLRDPRALGIVAPIAYLFGLTPGLSRMYLGEHWASDVLAGAFVGTWAGWRAVDYSHSHRRTRLDRTFLGDRSQAALSVGWTASF